MDLPHFALDEWLSAHNFATPPIEFDLASSTGPGFSVTELAQLGGGLDLGDVALGYAPPQGSAAVRTAVAALHDTDPDWVVMTTGASEALAIILCLASEPSANIVIPDPAYPAYAGMAQASGLATRAYAVKGADGFALDPEPILAAVTDATRLVLLNTPHNPTGVVMPRPAIAALAAALAERSIPLLVDEVYHPLYFGAHQPSAAGIPNVVVMSDLSKAMSLPGLRTGWIIEADPERRRAMINARSHFTISGSPLLERLATHALLQRDSILGRLQQVAGKNLALLSALIDQSGGRLSWTAPHGGTTCFPWFSDGRDSRPFCEALARAGVLVAPGDCFGHPQHVRIGFAHQEAGFATALERMAALL
ncbi:pyridoxal phosphate-dependent aminotransferase [Sandarakinorhabdus rubra]|uniref:pyridoxal phosphate-dependent aminotransferase n=1 Tax=Sandarakinorhabdus rubra TaxID=2672568 RepID=UPI0013D99BBE|nr:pyridoxal phosphate-dependent aminotransferase [Sandarakinorhabdus rubra]